MMISDEIVEEVQKSKTPHVQFVCRTLHFYAVANCNLRIKRVIL